MELRFNEVRDVVIECDECGNADEYSTMDNYEKQAADDGWTIDIDGYQTCQGCNENREVVFIS
jgi:hypothetical protein